MAAMLRMKKLDIAAKWVQFRVNVNRRIMSQFFASNSR